MTTALPRDLRGPSVDESAKRMSGLQLVIELDAAQLEAIAQRVAAILNASPSPAADGWLDTKGAAEHLATTPARIHDLVQLRKLEPTRDGRRLLFRRSDLDAYVEAAA